MDGLTGTLTFAPLITPTWLDLNMKRLLLSLLSLFVGTSVFAQSYPTAIDQNSSAGQTLRAPLSTEAPGTNTAPPVGVANPTLATWLSNSSASTISIENLLGLPSNPGSGSILYAVNPYLANGLHALTLTGSSPTIGTTTLGTWFILGDSYADTAGNEGYLSTSSWSNPPAQKYAVINGPSYPMVLSVTFNQPLSLTGRYTPDGNTAPLGHCYAIGGASINASTTLGSAPRTLLDQIATLVSDYPSGPPSNSVIFISIGINDVYLALSNGGQYSLSLTPWVTAGGTQTLGASTTNLQVVSSTGAVVGSTNYVSFPLIGGGNALCPISAVPDGTHITINSTGFGTFTVASGATIITGAQFGFSSTLNTLLSTLFAVPNIANCTIVLTAPPDLQYLPNFSSSMNLIHWTWEAYMAQFNSIIGGTTNIASMKNIRVLDLNPLFSDVIATPSKYGFKTATAEWAFSTTTAFQDFVFQDGFHYTEAMSRVIAKYSLDRFNAWGFVLQQ